MSKRRTILLCLALVAVASAVTITAVTATKPQPACACSIEPNVRGPAHDAAVRFETLVGQGDVAAAWGLLTDGARARYVDPAGFQPVFDRLTAAFEGAGGGWSAVDERLRYDGPSEVVVVRHTAGPPRLIWPLLVMTPLGRIGEERIEPEPPTLPMTAAADGDGVRVETPDADPDRTSYLAIDSTGHQSRPGHERLTPTTGRLTWTRPIEKPILLIAIEKTPQTLRIGTASTDQQ